MNTKHSNENSRELLHKYLDNSISKEELALLLRYFDEATDVTEGKSIYLEESIRIALQEDAAQIDPMALKAALANVDHRLKQRISETPPRIGNVPTGRRTWYRYAAAATLLLFAGGLLFTKFRPEPGEKWFDNAQATYGPTIGPGSNKATLSLEGGRSFILRESQNEIITGPHMIRYKDGSPLVEDLAPTVATLVIPRGGQYQLTLPDGTKVFLNSGSTLRYPTGFSGDLRIVELTGEAFFDVKNDPERPFIVKSDRQEIQVLGTRFNVYHHDGEPVVTTLEEGEVRILFNGKKPLVPTYLRPGQQSIWNDGESMPSVRIVNPDDYTSWTQNLFVFNNLPLTAIMKQLERWYDITVSYPKDFQDEHFFAEIPRDRTLSEVLRQLERSGNFTFEQKERRIIVHQ